MRYLLREMESGGHEYDAIVVDCGSEDLTPVILTRLADEFHALTVIKGGQAVRPVAEALPLCRGPWCMCLI